MSTNMIRQQGKSILPKLMCVLEASRSSPARYRPLVLAILHCMDSPGFQVSSVLGLIQDYVRQQPRPMSQVDARSKTYGVLRVPLYLPGGGEIPAGAVLRLEWLRSFLEQPQTEHQQPLVHEYLAFGPDGALMATLPHCAFLNLR